MKTQRRRSKALLLALATVLVCVVAVGMWRFLGQPSASSDASASSTPVVSDQVEATTTDSAQADDQAVETGESDDAATSDADYQQRVDEAQAADEAAGAGTSFEAGKALVTLADGATVDQVNAMLATMDGVSTKVVSDEDISNGYLLVDVAPTTSVEAATAELEQSEVVSAAQPNYLYQLMDEQIGTVSDLMEQTSPLTSTEPVTQLAADDAAAKTDAATTDAKTDADAATTDATTDAATTEAVTTDEAAAAAARQDAEAASTAATTTETTGAEALVATVQGISLNDDYWSLQWALHDTTGKTASVHADEAWTIQKTNKSVSVAIIDTGALTTHEDLDDNIVATYNSLTKGTDVTDTYGHGTHVAGIVSAESNNSTGVSGSSYDADLVIVKAANPNGGFSDAALLEAYSWIKDNASTYNIKVINMSLGGGGTPTSDDALMGEIDAAKTAGILTVCAAGNSMTSDYSDLPYAEYPGDYSSVLSVINLQYLSSDGTFLPARSSGSNYNTAGTTEDSSYTKDVSAPGTNIISTTKDGGCGNKTGTSMASPCVAGVAALLFAANTDITPDQVMGDLEATATDLNGDSTGTPTGDNVGWDVYTGYGEVNAYKAVLSANEVSIAGEDAVLLRSTLDLDATASTGTVTSWSWSSTDATVATVDDGVVTGAKAGTATITATATLSDGSTVSGSKKVTVIDASLSGPTFVGKDSTNTYSVAGGESLAWTYSTTNASIAPIAEGSGVLTAKEAGTVTVTATCVAHPTIKVTTRVTVVDASISGDDAVLKGSATAAYSVMGANGHTWKWFVTSLGGAAIIDASSGKLTATTTGKVKVTATSTENSSFILTKTVAIVTASISGASSVRQGASVTYTASTNPTTSGTWTWSVADGTGSATIDPSTGELTATKAGTVTVMATSSLGSTIVCTKVVTIVKGSLVGAAVSSVSNQIYTGSSINPIPVVSLAGEMLVQGRDYTLTYKDNVMRGTASIVITGIGNYAGSKTVTFEILPATLRLWGTTELDTMQAIDERGFSSSSSVVIATKESYWDALAASSLAGAVDAPILLSEHSSLPQQTIEEIKRLGATTAYVCGGPIAIASNVDDQLKDIGCKSVIRVYGQDQQGTARAIAQRMQSMGESSGTCLIVTANGFQDALSASPYSYAKGAPIFLVQSDTCALSAETLETIKSGSYTRVIIAGGQLAISASVESQLSSIGLSGSAVRRVYGQTEYETSSAFADFELTEGMQVNGVSVATALSYWDALTGSALCGHNNSVLVLADDKNRSAITGFVTTHSSSISQAYIFGGALAVSKDTADTLLNALD